MTDDQKRKIKRLSRHNKMTKRVDDLTIKIAEAKEELYSPRIASYDLIVGGKRSTRSFSDRKEKLMDKIEALEHDLILAMTEQAEEYGFILKCIDKLINKNPEYSLTLIYRYIKGLRMDEISKKLGHKNRRIYEIHKNVLDQLDI